MSVRRMLALGLVCVALVACTTTGGGGGGDSTSTTMFAGPRTLSNPKVLRWRVSHGSTLIGEWSASSIGSLQWSSAKGRYETSAEASLGKFGLELYAQGSQFMSGRMHPELVWTEGNGADFASTSLSASHVTGSTCVTQGGGMTLVMRGPYSVAGAPSSFNGELTLVICDPAMAAYFVDS